MASRDLEGLIARVEAATAGDREIDAEFALLFKIEDGDRFSPSASLDAITWLIERELPGWC